MMESKVLFNEAAKFGLGEDCCFVRAALGAYSKKAYFPKPDLCIGTVGATCDDMNAVMSEVEFLGYDIHYFELPHRHDQPQDVNRLKGFLTGQYERLGAKLEEVTGHEFDQNRFEETVSKVNQLRGAISELKGMLADSESSLDSSVRRNDVPNAMGAIEMLNVEFAPLSYYGDLDECIDVIEQVRETVELRQSGELGYPDQKIRLVWVTPPADPQLMNYIESLGGMIVGSEYLINQTTPQIIGGDNFSESLAGAHLNGSLMGSMKYRTNLVIDQVERSRAEGVIISGVFGSTHCPYETTPIVRAVRKKGIPVLAFDVVAPGKVMMQSQIYNRMEAFMESLKAVRRYRDW